MIRMTRLPEEVTRLLTPLKLYFSYRHYFPYCWLLVAHLVCFGKATVQGLGPYYRNAHGAWRLPRLLAAGRWAVGTGAAVVGERSAGGVSASPKMRYCTWSSTVP